MKQVCVRASDLGSVDGIRALVGPILDSTRDVHLDMSELGLEGTRRLPPLPLLLMSNLVMGGSAESLRRVTLPSDSAARLAVMRSGLHFSLSVAQQDSDNALNVDYPGLSPDAIQKWQHLWSSPWSLEEPSAGRLFDITPVRCEQTAEVPDVREYVKKADNAKKAVRVVVDPGLRSRESIMRDTPKGLTHYWLRLVTPMSGNAVLHKKRSMWMSLVSRRILKEILLNVVDHANNCPPSRPTIMNVRSLMILARTDGGGLDSYPRLRTLVTDNGYGLINTLRPKLQSSAEESDRRLGAGTTAEILRHAIEGPANTPNDPGLIWARDSFDTALTTTKESLANSDEDFLDAEFTLITSNPDRSDTAIWVTADGSDNIRTGELRELPFVGTTAYVTLPMPTAEIREPQPMMLSDTAATV